ncbi:stealth conserved region 3 domain-containing protein [Nocardiopsis sp. RSe5-2]|uniref:Stealth conserved region 3 domain-containing protein n=1 Tax=Nocardiopsis endophytica TaxID=3018445 RepID=A0ABT4U1Q6_9ACTN|nr:stealth conserved region 3 domain-containing protein [Nocardiopsis endophytica]MDA2810297.1 stealth conserved region 3 domain-containing protein [Nocardiopsis endophytica]
MKITYMVTWADAMGGTEAAAFSQAAALAGRHETRVLSVLRTADAPFFRVDPRVRVDHLVDDRGPVRRPVRSPGPGEDACRELSGLPSELVDPRWEPAYDRLCDIEAARALPRLDTDVLVTTTPALTALAAPLAPPGAALVAQEHRAPELRGPTGEPLLPFAPRVDALVALTEPSRSWLAETLGDAAPRLEAIPNAAPAGPVPRSSLDSRTVLVARRLVAEKQVDHAVRAFAQVAAEHPGWRLRICGQGPELPGLRALAAELDLHGRVEFAGPTADIAAEWARAAVCLLPSRTEPFGLVLTEAFAAGVPAVAYDCPTGPAEVVRHGVDGLLAAPDDVGGLAAALSKLMEDDALRAEMGRAALQGVGRFAPERIAARWERLFDDLVAVPPEERAAARADRAARFEARRAAMGAAVRALPWERTLPQAEGAGDHEEAWRRARPDLVRSGGGLAEVRDDLFPQQALRANLDLIVDALERWGVPNALVRHRGRNPRVMVPGDRRAEALAALARALELPGAEPPVYAQPIRPRGPLPQPVPLPMCPSLAESDGVRVFRPVVTSGRTLRYGEGYGADLEFWDPEPASGAASDTGGRRLAAPRACAAGDGVDEDAFAAPVRTRYAGREYTTLEPFARPLVDDVDHPIDAVVTWVDGDDPRWRRRFAAALAEHGGRAGADGALEHRFSGADELRYALRSIAMFAPWVRRIHLVTDDQVPSWLDRAHPGVRVVDHTALFADADLPTFNSHAIESRLHRVPGLSEHFLYFNDDMFLGRPVAPETFFAGNGSVRCFRSSTSVPFGAPSPEEPAYFAAQKNNRALLERAFGRAQVFAFRHAPYALRRSVLEELEDRFPEEFAATAAARFRGPTDLSPVPLHHYYAHLTGRAFPGSVKYAYVDLGDPGRHSRLEALLRRKHEVFCLTDAAPDLVPRDEQIRLMKAFLESYFPLRAPWEG